MTILVLAIRLFCDDQFDQSCTKEKAYSKVTRSFGSPPTTVAAASASPNPVTSSSRDAGDASPTAVDLLSDARPPGNDSY